MNHDLLLIIISQMRSRSQNHKSLHPKFKRPRILFTNRNHPNENYHQTSQSPTKNTPPKPIEYEPRKNCHSHHPRQRASKKKSIDIPKRASRTFHHTKSAQSETAHNQILLPNGFHNAFRFYNRSVHRRVSDETVLRLEYVSSIPN